MINYKKVKPVYSFVMAPFYLVDDDDLLRVQLINLNNQTNKNFEVIIPDPHYSKRSWMNNFVENLDYNVIQFPYVSNVKIPKSFDYCIYNNAVLMSNTNKIVPFNDWRFCHHDLVKYLYNLKQYKFIGFKWQVLYKDENLVTGHDGAKSNYPKSTIDISLNEAAKMYTTGNYPNIKNEMYFLNTFINDCWGHYCMDRDLWMIVNGVDEVATNTRKYADLDFNTRLEEYFRRNRMQIKIPMIKNVMVRIMHNCGHGFAGSNESLSFQPNMSHLECCFLNWRDMNGDVFLEYVKNKIKRGEYIQLYKNESPKDKHFTIKHTVIGFQCKKCNVIGETPHWYEKFPRSRIKSMVGIGVGNYKLGRNLLAIEKYIKNKSFEEKIKILNESWYDEKFLKY